MLETTDGWNSPIVEFVSFDGIFIESAKTINQKTA